MHVFLLLLIAPLSYGARILFLPAQVSSTSHKKSMAPLAEALGRRGHQVTFWNAEFVEHKLKSSLVEDKTLLLHTEDKDVLEMFKYANHTKSDEVVWTARRTDPIGLLFPWYFAKFPTQLALQKHMSVVKHIAAEHWDIIIYDTLFNPFGFSIVLTAADVPTIPYTTSIIPDTTLFARGIPTANSYVPTLGTAVNFKSKDFWQRLEDSCDYLKSIVVTRVLAASFRFLYGSLFNGFTFDNLESQGKLAMSAFPLALDWSKPQMPDMIYVGGCETQETHVLPEEIRAFVEDPASRGTIVAAFGHHIQWKAAPKRIVEAFSQAFSQLADYRIIWQYPDDADLPKMSHVKRLAWLPQPALLQHSKTVAFVSHMGLKSITEAICLGVPVVAFPLFAEQARHAQMVKQMGVGVVVDKFTITATSFSSQLHEISSNVSYRMNAKKWVSHLADFHLIQPMELGVWYVEYILRHSNTTAAWFHSKAKNLNFVQYFCLDCIILLFLCACICFAFLGFIFWLGCKCVISKKI